MWKVNNSYPQDVHRIVLFWVLRKMFTWISRPSTWHYFTFALLVCRLSSSSSQDEATGNITVINSSRLQSPTGELNTISGWAFFRAGVRTYSDGDYMCLNSVGFIIVIKLALLVLEVWLFLGSSPTQSVAMLVRILWGDQMRRCSTKRPRVTIPGETDTSAIVLDSNPYQILHAVFQEHG